MKNLAVAFFCGSLATQEAQPQSPSSLPQPTYWWSNSAGGKSGPAAISLINKFMWMYCAGDSFDYLRYYRKDASPNQQYIQTSSNRSHLEEEWRTVQYEKAIGLYVCTSDSEATFLLRDEGSMDFQALRAIDNFVESGKLYSPGERVRIRMLTSSMDPDIVAYLADVESRIELGDRVMRIEKETYSLILGYYLRRRVMVELTRGFPGSEKGSVIS